VYAEGTFLSRQIAENVTATYFREYLSRTTCVDGPFIVPVSEMDVVAILEGYCRAVKSEGGPMTRQQHHNWPRKKRFNCGERVSLLLAGNHEFEASEEDLWRVRCSPFSVPFAFKRVDRSKGNPLRRAILNIVGNASEHHLMRVVNDARCPVW
jgi:hypothetical protein